MGRIYRSDLSKQNTEVIMDQRIATAVRPGRLPAVHSGVFETIGGKTPYLKGPGVVMLAAPAVDLTELVAFLGGFDPALEFPQYLDDPTELPPAEQLVKMAGQACYASWGPNRTMNDAAERYIGNLLSSGHGSVLEHANFTLFFYGVSRSFTHELVRHRAGWAYSQLSQRYVSGKVLRFVERPEYQKNRELHARFEHRIDQAAEEYNRVARLLKERQEEGDGLLAEDAATELRKKVQQTARSVLPNETETHIVTTANVRSWRHFIEMRANPHAEIEIRQGAVLAYRCLVAVAPILFGDYEEVRLPDGTTAVETEHRKV